MKNLFLLFAFLSIVPFSNMNAQDGNGVMQTKKNIVLFDLVSRNYLKLDYVEIYEGTPYNNPNFLVGDIYINDKITAPNTSLRYNIYADEIEVKEYPTDDESNLKALTKSPDIYVTILKDKFVYIPMQESMSIDGYFKVLHEGKNNTLYKKLVKKYFPPKKAKTSFERDLPGSFKDRPIYFIMSKDGTMTELPTSKKKIAKALSQVNENVTSYIKKSKINVQNEDGLLKAFRYCENK